MDGVHPSRRTALSHGYIPTEVDTVERVEVRPLEAGIVLGGAYRVLYPLAAGGIGFLYQGEHVPSRERRTIEVMHGPFVSEVGLRARFAREMRLGASIPSEHVAQVLDAGQDEATRALYVVTEFLDGTTLSTTLDRRGPLAWPTALAVLRQIADALRAAHARGIIHRELKPANVFLVHAPGTALSFAVKVLDFGVYKAVFAGGEGAPAAIPSTAWTAPEVVSPSATSAVGPQSDVWSFGLVAFTILTGKPYFPSGSTEPEGVLRDAPAGDLGPASERAAQYGAVPRLPVQFDAWFERCVDRDPRRRFDDVKTALEELAGLTPPEPIDPEPPSAADPEPPSDADPTEDPDDTLELPRADLAPHWPPAPMPTMHPPARGGWLGPVLVAAAGVIGAVVAVLIFVSIRASEGVPAAQAAPGAGPSRAVVRLHGSNTAGAELAPALAEAFLRRRTGASTIVRRRVRPDELVVETRDGALAPQSVEIAAHGSATAFEDLGSGSCDIGMASRRIHDDEAAKVAKLGDLTSAASEHVVALDGIAVIVNPANAISLLTRDQLADVFSGRVRRWSQVGGKDTPIVVHARDDKSGTYDTFAHLVLTGRELAANALRHESSEELSDAVAADAQAIGFIGLPYIRHAKALMVQENGSVPLLPSAMTVSTEDYLLSRRLYFYVPLGASVAAHDFVDFTLSEDGQKAVAAAGFVDLRPECEPVDSPCPSCAAEYRAIVDGACRLSTDFRFVHGSAQLDGRGLSDLQRLSALMGRVQYRSKSIALLGFSDSLGDRAGNMRLAQERASVVAIQLRARGLSVEVERGFGADMPVADNATEEGRMRNRRVEVWLR
jgi:phosphate transport system substrate-binding protein